MKVTLLYKSTSIILLLFLVGCRSEFQPVNVADIPLTVSQSNDNQADLDVIIPNVETIVTEKLPDAYFADLVFTGKCQDLPDSHGKIIVSFIQVKTFLFSQQILFATSTVNTHEQEMELSIRDYSDPYTRTEGNPLVTDQQFKEVLHIAYQHLVGSGVADCEVTITQGKEVWNVLCGSLSQPKPQLCDFGINVETGEITRPVLNE